MFLRHWHVGVVYGGRLNRRGGAESGTDRAEAAIIIYRCFKVSLSLASNLAETWTGASDPDAGFSSCCCYRYSLRTLGVLSRMILPAVESGSQVGWRVRGAVFFFSAGG